ncbi:type II secretion system protein [Prosthecobacter fluviatilis]|uniref:Type II secretion system protein n=1 Tax=Prosthecobacter fluviatilis TaxID=445931 RepID=A0ABW0KL98_9BACT
MLVLTRPALGFELSFGRFTSAGEVDSPAFFLQQGNRALLVMTMTFRRQREAGFSFVEAIFTIAIIGIMSSIVVAAISNASRDASRVMARQQQASVQSALTAWVMAQMRVSSNSAQFQSLENIRVAYNAMSVSQRFDQLVPKPNSSDPNRRAGFLDQTTADHFADYTSNASQLQTLALYNSQQYLTLPDWQTGDFPHVDLVNM